MKWRVIGLVVLVVAILSFYLWSSYTEIYLSAVLVGDSVEDCTGQADGVSCVFSSSTGGGVSAFAAAGSGLFIGVCSAGVCVPVDPPQDLNGPCAGDGTGPTDPKQCTSRDGKTTVCCAKSDSCGVYGDRVVWCVPPSCPPADNPLLTKRCTKGTDAVCCLASEACSTYQGFAWCKTTRDSCRERGQGETCGSYGCCPSCLPSLAPEQGRSSEQKPCGNCTDYGVMKCDYTQCGSGQELCKGKVSGLMGGEIAICCNTGTCVDGDIDDDGDYDRTPTCSDGDHNPF